MYIKNSRTFRKEKTCAKESIKKLRKLSYSFLNRKQHSLFLLVDNKTFYFCKEKETCKNKFKLKKTSSYVYCSNFPSINFLEIKGSQGCASSFQWSNSYTTKQVSNRTFWVTLKTLAILIYTEFVSNLYLSYINL